MSPVPHLYEELYARQVFTTDEAVVVLDQPRRRTIEQLSRLRSRGYLQRLRRGLYAIVPVDERGSPSPPNPYLVASKLADPYLLSFHTGLELHGVAQSSFSTKYVAAPTRFQPLEHEGVRYRPVGMSHDEVEAAATSISIQDQPISVATREWTAAHCLKRLDLSGGLEEVLKSLAGFAHLRPERLLEACKKLGQRNLFHRAGLVLELNQERWHVEDEQLELFRSRLSDHTDYFGTEPGNATYVKDWNLMVPENLDQVMRAA